MVEVFGIGCCNLDHILLVKQFPEPDEKINASEYHLMSGGVIGNYLTAVSRLGVSAGFIGALGDDEAGRFLLEDLQKEKVDLSLLKIKQAMKSPETFIMVTNEGEKIIIQSPFLIKTRLAVPEDFDEGALDKITRVRLIHTSHIHDEVSNFVIQHAREHNPDVTVSFDLEKQVILQHGQDAILQFLDLVDILVPQKQGIMELTKMKNPAEAAKSIMKKKSNLKLTVVTLGKDGCMITYRKNETIHQDTYPGFKIKPVDVTGAGDAFNAAFDVGYLSEWDMEKIALFANAAGALNCLKVGARSGMVAMEEVIKFINDKSLNSLSLTV